MAKLCFDIIERGLDASRARWIVFETQLDPKEVPKRSFLPVFGLFSGSRTGVPEGPHQSDPDLEPFGSVSELISARFPLSWPRNHIFTHFGTGMGQYWTILGS